MTKTQETELGLTPKPGRKTTEFWVAVPTVVGAMCTALAQGLADNPSPTAKAIVVGASVIAAGLAAAGYAVARGMAKH